VVSIKEAGVIEPPVVARHPTRKGRYLLLDGHLRIEALKELGETNVVCIVSTDDEAYTYNKRISRLATVQEHRMILRAIKRGVSEKRIAKALDIDVTSIRRKRRLLDGISSEVAELLKDKHCPIHTFQCLKRMSPMRQIECAELMIAVNNYSVAYAKALLAATPQDQLVEPAKPKSVKGLAPEQMARMEREMSGIQQEIKLVQDSYGPDVLNLVLARGYLTSLLGNTKVAKFLSRHHPEMFTEFQKIVAATSLTPSEP
jgi:hypothetical protein